MKCHRCGGKMVYEKFYGEEERFYGWRCIFCGEIVDQVISENRDRGGRVILSFHGRSDQSIPAGERR
ncbi:MAG: hypothetical protein A2W09_03010 [Deltaproteobacteria bacterium RBG_16_50_11]|nr:MAG: hypothetical protein A2W09_03010 [Deltaproteobacteria bacterium RBG_16_50_11]